MRVDASRCEDVRKELSARLDDEDSPDRRTMVSEHVARCMGCRRYRDALVSIRRQIRVQPAPRVPDLTPSILAEVRGGSQTPGIRPFLRTAMASALTTALLAGALSIPGGRDRVDVASASEIVSQIRAAARHTTRYHATFDVRERGWDVDVDERRLEVSVWYRAPELLRVEAHDLTSYPPGNRTPNDALLITNETRAYVRQRQPCPPPTLSGCSAPARPTSRLTRHRQPLEGSFPNITDIVLPLETLASADGIDVLGLGGEILGRQTIRVRLPFWQGHVLASAVRPASPRTFDPAASVDLWLDAESWFPLRFTITEPGAGDPGLTVTATSVAEEDVPLERFEVPGRADHVVDTRFRPGRPPELRPSFLAGLKPYRSGHTPDGHRIASFARGLSWLVVVTSSDRDPPKSLLYSDAVTLPSGSSVYYEPAGYEHARVVDIFDDGNHVRLESNLPRETLLDIGASVPVEGEVVPRIRRGPVTIARVDPDVVLELPFFERPTEIPAGYQPSNATITKTNGHISSAVLRYSDPENEYAGAGIVITAAPGEVLLPASAEPFSRYLVARESARWSPLRGELEWVEDGTYRSVRVADFRADFAVSIARSLR